MRPDKRAGEGESPERDRRWMEARRARGKATLCIPRRLGPVKGCREGRKASKRGGTAGTLSPQGRVFFCGKTVPMQSRRGPADSQ